MTYFWGSPASLAIGAGALVTGVVVVLVLLAVPDRARLAPERRRPGVGPEPTFLERFSVSVTEVVGRILGNRGASTATLLERAGVRTPLREVVIIVGAGALAAFALGLVLGRPLFGVFLALLAPVAARVVLALLVDRREKAFAAQLDESLQMMAGSLRAGYSLPQAVATLATEAEKPTSEEFARVTNETRVGRPLIDALEDAAQRVRNDDFYWVTQAIAINREVGGNLADVLEGVSRTIRQRIQLRRQVDALAAEGKLSAIILMLLPFVVFGLLTIVQPSYLIRLTQSLTGWLMMGAGVVMLTIGGFWLRKITIIKF